MIKISRWRSCVNNPPKKDGDYLVIKLHNHKLSYASKLPYTTIWGWNTYRDPWGGEHSNRIEITDKSYLWAEVTYEKRKIHKKMKGGDDNEKTRKWKKEIDYGNYPHYICPYCNEENSWQSPFCPMCGKKIKSEDENDGLELNDDIPECLCFRDDCIYIDATGVCMNPSHPSELYCHYERR